MERATPIAMEADEIDPLRSRLQALLTTHAAALLRLAASYEARASDRDDLYQDICLALCRALPNFRGECSERTFVFRVAHNRALSRHWKARDRRSELEVDEHLPDPAAGPVEHLSSRERRERLLAAVRSLPLALCQTLSLGLEGLPQSEIAEVLGVSENVVAVRMHRARAELRRRLGEPA